MGFSGVCDRVSYGFVLRVLGFRVLVQGFLYRVFVLEFSSGSEILAFRSGFRRGFSFFF